MKKKYLAVVLLLMFLGITYPKALTVNDCKVLVSFKLSSSLDEEKYICKGIDFGNRQDAIYYSGTEDIVYLNNFSAYYFTNWEDYNVTINISGNNTISLLQLGNSKFKVIGKGSLKFKQNSFVKKVINGDLVNYYVYNGKILLNQDKKIYEGTTLEFKENYELLKEINNLPLEYNLEDYKIESVIDYTKMTPVIVTENWLIKHIETNLEKNVNDGYGIIKYIEPENQPIASKKEETTTQLEADNVILISEEKLKTKYELKETNLKEKEIATKVSENINQDLISLYDVSVYNGESEVLMKNGKYTLKIKLDESYKDYEDYQIIYINDKGEVEEYLNGYIENDYIVFETTHLSQYGVIATPKNEKIIVNINDKKKFLNKEHIIVIFKISILLSIIGVAIILVNILIIKSKSLTSKKRRA